MKTKTLTCDGGLVTEPGVWRRAESSLSTAYNLDLSAPGCIQKRRGFSNVTLNSFSGSVWGAFSSPVLERDVGTGALLLATGTPGGGVSSLRVGIRTSTFSTISGGTWTVGIVNGDPRPKLTTGSDGKDILAMRVDGGESGPVVLDYLTLTGRRLGLPRGMGLDRQNTALSGATGFLSATSACRYAVVFTLGDPTTNGVQFGSPGMTTVVTNSTGASADVATRVLLPMTFGTASTTLTADVYWVQVYRSVVQATSLGEPPSELALVYQKQISAADIAAGYVAFTDSVPDNLRGANLYTNILTGEDGFAGRGFVNSNEPPPVCSDVATWADCLWLADLLDWPTQELQLISVGGTGLVAGDTVTTGGVTYTGVAAAPAANQFIVSAAGTASVNQRETALNLVDAINRSASNTSVWAYYVAGQAGLPGRIIIRGRLSNTGISSSVSRAAAWRVGTEDANNPVRSGLAFSKSLQPFAHPAVNRFEVGRGDATILRIVPYRDSLFVFKEDGLFRVTGSDYSDFQVTEFDTTFRLIGRECVALVDDAIYAWGTQGIGRITDGGVEYVDLPVRDRVLGAMKLVQQTTLRDWTFAVGNQRDGYVAFFRPTLDPSSDAAVCSNAFVFYARTNSWVEWNVSTTGDRSIGYCCGTSNVFDHLVSLGVWQVAPASGAYLHNERRAYSSSDFSDPSMASTASPTMAASAFASYVGWRPIAADALGAAQWVQGRLEFELASTTRQGPPTISVQFYGDEASSIETSVISQGTSPTNVTPTVMVAPVDQGASRGHSVQPFVIHTTLNNGFTLIGVSVDYRPTSVRGVAR